MIIYWAIGGCVLYNIPKGDLERFVNSHHHSVLDYFFLLFTYLGDGVTLAIILVYLLIINIYKGIIGITALLISTIITHYLKHFVFQDHDRPYRFFKDIKDIYYVEGIEINAYNSFPSGHTSASFCVFAVIAFLSSNKKLGLLFWCIAFLVSLSRIYLMQHFFVDTYFGAMIGVLSATLVIVLFQLFLPNTHLLGRPLFKRK
jgi:membrane-associated phospholipid phosphatase